MSDNTSNCTTLPAVIDRFAQTPQRAAQMMVKKGMMLSYRDVARDLDPTPNTPMKILDAHNTAFVALPLWEKNYYIYLVLQPFRRQKPMSKGEFFAYHKQQEAREKREAAERRLRTARVQPRGTTTICLGG